MSWLKILLAGITGASAAVTYYPPLRTNTNNLTFAVNGTGAPGIFTSSVTPDKIYGIYNWCNMPRVREREYKTPSKDFELEYVEVIHRHHKRTPYNSNTFFKEDVTWDCRGSGPLVGLATLHTQTSQIEVALTTAKWQAAAPPANPFSTTVGPGFVGSTCQFPGITEEGLEDAFDHGRDLRAVYGKRLGLSESFDPSESSMRVTNNPITSQVAAGLAKGLFPHSSQIPVEIQPSSFDSLEPTYSCPAANNLRNGFTTGNKGQIWQQHLAATQSLYEKLDRVSGISNPDSGGWHVSFDHYYDNMSAKLCHAKRLPCSVNETHTCVTQSEADTVFRLGNWEYSYLFRDAPDSAAYSALRFGAFFLELKAHLTERMQGKSRMKYRHNIGHDGSMAPLLGTYQIETMMWPGMAAQAVHELYRNKRTNKYFIRVLYSGQPLRTSTPLGVLDMIKIEDFFAYIDSMIGSAEDLRRACNS